MWIHSPKSVLDSPIIMPPLLQNALAGRAHAAAPGGAPGARADPAPAGAGSADVNRADDMAMTPLHHAAVNGQAMACTELLDHGARPDPKLSVRAPSHTCIAGPWAALLHRACHRVQGLCSICLMCVWTQGWFARLCLLEGFLLR